MCAALRLVCLAFAVLVAAHLPALAATPRRLALVIGIDNYATIPQLRKAGNDAKAVRDQLAKLGFEVMGRNNLGRRAFAAMLAEFEAKVRPGDTTLFFFAGHGFEIRGRNFLIPADMPPLSDVQQDQIEANSFAAVDIRDRLLAKGAQVTIAVIDACRNNPFARPGEQFSRSPLIIRVRGLARPEMQTGSFEMLSAGPQQLALDRLSDTDTDPNSVFTRVLLKHLGGTPRPIDQIAKEVSVEVEQLARSIGHDQSPTYTNGISGNYLLVPTSYANLSPAAWTPPAVAPAEAAQRCDRFAAAPYDAERPASLRGVYPEFIPVRAAVEACEAAAGPGASARLHYQLGRAYLADGRRDLARQSYQRAAERNYAAAIAALGELLFDESATRPTADAQRAAAYFQAARSRNARAEALLGVMTIKGQIPSYETGSDAAYQAGLQALIRAHARGDAEGAFWLGLAHYLGRGVGQNMAQAEDYFNAATARGLRRAVLYLGNLNRDWTARRDHLAIAASYWERASNLGSPQATVNLAKYYLAGPGGAATRAKACTLFERATELGQPLGWTDYASICNRI